MRRRFVIPAITMFLLAFAAFFAASDSVAAAQTKEITDAGRETYETVSYTHLDVYKRQD